MSFKLKTILLFLAVSLIPYALTMFLVGNSFRQELYDAVTQEMNTQLHLSVERIDQHLLTLHNDMAFLAKSDIMNDVYTKDFDRRISNNYPMRVGKIKISHHF